jgi:hypothetical protein
VGMWVCGYVGMWVCGYVGMWVCGYVGMWVCGYVGMWVCGYVGMWVCGSVKTNRMGAARHHQKKNGTTQKMKVERLAFQMWGRIGVNEWMGDIYSFGGVWGLCVISACGECLPNFEHIRKGGRDIPLKGAGGGVTQECRENLSKKSDPEEVGVKLERGTDSLAKARLRKALVGMGERPPAKGHEESHETPNEDDSRQQDRSILHLRAEFRRGGRGGGGEEHVVWCVSRSEGGRREKRVT